MQALEALAAFVGIEDCFQDAKGQTRVTSLDTKKALLSALGFPVETDDQARTVLHEWEERRWRKSLPPVQVVYGQERKVTLEVVAPAGAAKFNWTLHLESGGTRSGSAPLKSGTFLASREFAGAAWERHRVDIEGDLPIGYHNLTCGLDDAECCLIVSPGQCWLPTAASEGPPLWGVAAQLYLLRSARNWGIGDFTDLRDLVQLIDRLGGDVVGLNPLHSLFADNPEHASPYSPESRLLLNILYIDVEAVPEFSNSPETRELAASDAFRQKLAACRAAHLVDYAGVAELKLQALKLLFDCCRVDPSSPRWREFQEFRSGAGAAFEQNCLFEALRQHFAAITGRLADWHTWPADYQRPDSPAVRCFAEENAGAVTFHAWLQWLADQQLAAAAGAAKNMDVGLYRDLAVGTDSSGAGTWSNPDAVVSGAHIGAPPDIFNPAGQDWGLPPFHPRILYETAYRDFILLVRANMRHAGGLRIDHAMGFQHLYWVPKDKSPGEGAYVTYPLDDLIAIVALESHRNRCLVVGEDLGTVPEGFRERMMESNILSYRVLFFEQDSQSGKFHSPKEYPRLALAVAGSHDLPTVRGWWNGADIDIKEHLHLFPAGSPASEARDRRERDRGELLRALRTEGLLPERGPVGIEDLSTAVHAYLARTHAMITVAQMDDITAEIDPVNVPATSDEHPNWKRRLSVNTEQLPEYGRLLTLARTFERERQRAVTEAVEESPR